MSKKIKKAKNPKEYCNILAAYIKKYNEICTIISQQYERTKNTDIINDFLALETIIPIKLIMSGFNMIYNINHFLQYEISSNIIKTLTMTVKLPVTYDLLVFYHSIADALALKNIDLNYDYINLSVSKLSNLYTEQETINKWTDNLEKSISMFSDIIYPLISKAFFTILFAFYFDGNTRNIKDTLIKIKNILKK